MIDFPALIADLDRQIAAEDADIYAAIKDAKTSGIPVGDKYWQARHRLIERRRVAVIAMQAAAEVAA